MKKPCECTTWPEPLHCPHADASLPGAAPLPEQSETAYIAHDLNVLGAAVNSLGKTELELNLQIRTTSLTLTAASTTKEITEKVAERREDVVGAAESPQSLRHRPPRP